MAKKSKYAIGKSFSIDVSDSIRHHGGMADALMSKREIAFEERDSALGAKHEAPKDSAEYQEACDRHSNAVEQIDDLSADIKWHSKKLIEIAKKADSPDISIEYERPDEPPPSLKPAKNKDKDDAGQLKMQLEAPVAEGEDQQLAVDISNLDLSGPLQAKLRRANVNTIAQLVVIADDRKRNLRDELDLGNAQVDVVEASLEKYRKRHRKAIAEADKEGAAPKR